MSLAPVVQATHAAPAEEVAPPPVYYVVGPPGMVNGLHRLLNQADIDDDDIRAEEFGGY